jgi:hypothetical protein
MNEVYTFLIRIAIQREIHDPERGGERISEMGIGPKKWIGHRSRKGSVSQNEEM